MSTGRKGGTHALVSGVDGEWLPSLVWLTGVGGLVEVAENKGTSTFNNKLVVAEVAEVAAVAEVVEVAEVVVVGDVVEGATSVDRGVAVGTSRCASSSGLKDISESPSTNCPIYCCVSLSYRTMVPRQSPYPT